MSSLIVGRRSCRGVQDRLLRISEPGHSTNPARWAMRWKPALNAFVITFDDRIVPLAYSPNGRLTRSSDIPPGRCNLSVGPRHRGG